MTEATSSAIAARSIAYRGSPTPNLLFSDIRRQARYGEPDAGAALPRRYVDRAPVRLGDGARYGEPEAERPRPRRVQWLGRQLDRIRPVGRPVVIKDEYEPARGQRGVKRDTRVRRALEAIA